MVVPFILSLYLAAGPSTTTLLEESRKWAHESEYDKAMEYVLEALEAANKAGDKTGRAASLCEMASLDILTWRDAQAWEHAVEAERLSREIHSDTLLCDALLQKGRICVYSNMDGSTPRENEALGYFDEALSLSEKAGSIARQVEILYNISQALVNVNRFNDPLDGDVYRKAGEAIEKGESIARENGRHDLLEKALPYKIRYFRQGGRLEDAILACNEALSLSGMENHLFRSQVFNHLTVLYGLTGNWEESARAHQEFANTTQLYMQQKSDFILQELETSYEAKSKEQQIRQMRRGIWYLSTMALLLAILFAVSVWTSRKLHRQKIALDEANRGKAELLRLISTSLASPEFGVQARKTMDDISRMDEPRARAHCLNILKDVPEGVREEVTDYLINLNSQRKSAAKNIGLTEREIEIIRCCRDGYSNAQIAQTLHISLSTVKNHKQNIFYKLDARSTQEMLTLAESLGIL